MRYEKIFGDGYVSTGGPETTAYLCAKLGTALRPGVRVLDVGSGIGGAAFHLASEYGAVVTGVDLSEEMVAIARERAARLEASPESVTFLLADILTAAFDGHVRRRLEPRRPHAHPRQAAALRAALRPARPGRAARHHRLRPRDRRPASPEFRDYIARPVIT